MEERKDGGLSTVPNPTVTGGDASSNLPTFQPSNPLLQVKNLCVHYPIQKGIFKRTVGYVYAVDDVTLNMPRGKTLALVGESGSGKTSFGKAILRLGVPVEGDLVYDGVNIETATRQHMHPYRKRMQIIFQDPYASLNPRMTVGAILQEGMQAHNIGESTEERQNRVAELMQRVGLSPDMVTRYPHEFSGGQRQRIGIARCLAVDPEFIVCDEGDQRVRRVRASANTESPKIAADRFQSHLSLHHAQPFCCRILCG